MSDPVRFLVVDGYPRAARAELTAAGATPGSDLYAAMLQSLCPGSRVDIVHPADPGARLPTGAALPAYDGIAWTGSSLSVYRGGPEIDPQIDLARAAYAANVPTFGSCWAAQVAVVAAGGTVQANPQGREIGIGRKIALNPAGRAHPLFTGKADVFDAPTSHVDEITHLPPGAVALAGNGVSAVQAVAISHAGGRFWSVQYHPEFDLHEIARLVFCRLDSLVAEGFFEDRADGEAWVARAEALHQDPSRRDLAWALGIDADILSEELRLIEVRNWIERMVLPARAARA